MKETIARNRLVMDEALGIVTRGTDGFSVTLDADFLDPQDSPGVATRFAAARLREAHLAMEMIADTKRMASLRLPRSIPFSTSTTTPQLWNGIDPVGVRQANPLRVSRGLHGFRGLNP
jgi:hypothetical protein